jgi:hypothetical protein
VTHALRADYGLFSAHVHSSGLWPCLNGDLLRALWHFGYGDHPTVRTVIEALARRVIADGFVCVRNGGLRSSGRPRDKRTWQPCVWGCVKVLRGFAAIPPERCRPAVQRAIKRGVDFLLAHDLTQEQRPALVEVDAQWLRFGFPLGYGSDLLEALLALAELDVQRARLEIAATRVILERKRDERGRWPLEHALRNTWAEFEQEGAPNKWVTLRALKVLGVLFRAERKRLLCVLGSADVEHPERGC